LDNNLFLGKIDIGFYEIKDLTIVNINNQTTIVLYMKNGEMDDFKTYLGFVRFQF